METEVLIIGGGVTGTGIARDLALRGVQCLLVEKADINSGASGGNHGLLHSGARYVASDARSAAECMVEGRLLKQLAPHCIDDCGGMFVALEGDDEAFISNFPVLCNRIGLAAEPLSPNEAREREPALSERVIAAFSVEDAAIDPFMLSLDNIAHARTLGTHLCCHTRVSEFEIEGGRINRVWLEGLEHGKRRAVEPRVVVNATGAWAGHVTALAGITLSMRLAMGTLLVTQSRLTDSVINRLRPPSDGDILVPGGTVSILGTTSRRITDPDRILPSVEESDLIVSEGAMMVPELETTRYIRAYSGVRPLAVEAEGQTDDRNASRGILLLDHQEAGIDNFVTITGGKLTTFRLMAEETSDLVCRKLSNASPCLTQSVPLPATEDGRWTEPGTAPRRWIQKGPGEKDRLLCECEMISEKTFDEIVARIRQGGEVPSLLGVGRRSRLGKGPCQGAFCSARVLAYLYHQEAMSGQDGISDLKLFLSERWKGQRPIFWGDQLRQAELTEAMHCGLFDLELARCCRRQV